MTKIIALLLVLVMIFTLAACKASKTDVKRADDFLTGLASFTDANPISSIDKLADLSASVVTLPSNAFDFSKGWEKKTGEREKYLYIYNSDATLSIYTPSDNVSKVTYTFCVDTVKDIYNAADNLIDIYGDPALVYLDGVTSSHSEVDRSTNDSNNKDLTYSYVWKTELHSQTIYVYVAYYYASGINFSYIVISNFLNIANSNPKKFWD